MNDTQVDFESTVEGLMDIMSEGESNPPVEKTVKEQAEVTPDTTTNVEEDEYDSILDEIMGVEKEETEASEDPENEAEETEEAEEEQEEGDDQEHVVKIDGEEHTVTLSELKKGYGLQSSLTRKGQELAEMRKSLDAEADAVAWVKAQPKVKELADDISLMQAAIDKGFQLTPDGNINTKNGQPVALTPQQIEAGLKEIEAKQAELMEVGKPPRLDDLYEAIPELQNPASEEAQAILKPFGETLADFGYSQPEITSLNDPRTFLMLKELHELREMRSRVEKAKARRAEKKPTTASKVTKSARPASPTQKSSTASKSKITIDQINKGEANLTDWFMED